jgi:hypothetical protein
MRLMLPPTSTSTSTPDVGVLSLNWVNNFTVPFISCQLFYFILFMIVSLMF